MALCTRDAREPRNKAMRKRGRYGGSLSHPSMCFSFSVLQYHPTEKCLLSNNIRDYYFVSQGKTTIPGLDDGEEMQITDVSARPPGLTLNEDSRTSSSYNHFAISSYVADILLGSVFVLLDFQYGSGNSNERYWPCRFGRERRLATGGKSNKRFWMERLTILLGSQMNFNCAMC